MINLVNVLDLTTLATADLGLNFNAPPDELTQTLNDLIRDKPTVRLDNSRGDIRELLPLIDRNGQMVRQTRYDFSTAKRPNEYGMLVSGFPLKDEARHYRLARRCGNKDGSFIGFMDDNTPVRVRQDPSRRFSNQPDRVWLQLRPTFIDVNLTKVQSGAQDKYAYCAYDLPSARATMSWFAITKILNGRYPLWANQYDIWSPKLPDNQQAEAWYAGCMAFVLAENRCVVTRFEANNPVAGAPEVFVDNPLCPTNRVAFWATTLNEFVLANGSAVAVGLVEAVRVLYQHWNQAHCQGQWLTDVGLRDEPYFRYFDYGDFLTPYSGLVQLRKYTEQANLTNMGQHIERVQILTRQLREELYQMLTEEFGYFG